MELELETYKQRALKLLVILLCFMSLPILAMDTGKFFYYVDTPTRNTLQIKSGK